MATVILKETRDFDNKGNLISYDEVEETPREFVEPFDPAYLEASVDDGGKISGGEAKYVRMVARLQRALVTAGVRYKWDETCFVIKSVKHGVERLRCLWVDAEDGTFCYGTWNTCMFYGKKVSEVIEKAQKFVA
jgi:hypothetical protein